MASIGTFGKQAATPAGVGERFFDTYPVVSLRSTTGLWLRSLRDRGRCGGTDYWWYRCAQPPANGCDPYGIVGVAGELIIGGIAALNHRLIAVIAAGMIEMRWSIEWLLLLPG